MKTSIMRSDTRAKNMTILKRPSSPDTAESMMYIGTCRVGAIELKPGSPGMG
jgi:hypothetical protein